MKQNRWYGRVFRDREIWFCLALLCCIVWESALLMGMVFRHEITCKGTYALALGIIARTVEEEIQTMPTDLEKCSFGDSFLSDRSYGGERKHYGTDLMDLKDTPGSLPIYSMTQGIVTNLGWNELGGWRVGVTSPSGVYYYYAHLRQNYPYREQLKEGDVVTAGDVIGYMGHTGYSTKENVNNIDTVHLHFGLQLIFDEAQKEGNNEIWVDCYNLTRFLYKNRSAVQKVGESREWKRTLQMTDPAVVKYQKTVKKQ